ncbi:MAG: hypothetical protein COV67_15460 [Nitrospinae bacterium CG11_big_fil_rev_8_21_14_0_20_56_8]|nr:MAG: hypothetical protein COV67_15460 [Nitrospinae bacterium CG11_big_fil_rev_8_21_14_0_20_56_8]
MVLNRDCGKILPHPAIKKLRRDPTFKWRRFSNAFAENAFKFKAETFFFLLARNFKEFLIIDNHNKA